MCWHKMLFHKILIGLLALFTWFTAQGQVYELRKNPEVNALCQKTVNALYAWEFKKADSLLLLVDSKVGDHPVSPFLHALKIYWQQAPFDHENDHFPEYWVYILDAEQKADSLFKNFPENDELIYFRLVIDMIMARVYDKSGESLKAVGKIKNTYELIKKGFEMKDKNPEFMFTTGLYNYYREAYPDKYPIYKPFAWFFQSGNRELGLQQLEFAAKKSLYSRTEANRFLSLNYRKYENIPAKSVEYAERNYLNYPTNYILLQEYTEVLILTGKYEQAFPFIQKLKANGQNPYFHLAGLTFEAMYTEYFMNDIESAYLLYQKAEQLVYAGSSKGKFLKSYIYAGLSRYHAHAEDKNMSKHYFKLAKKFDFNSYMESQEKKG